MSRRDATADSCAESIPDRTPPSTAGRYRTRVQKTCAVCSGPFLVAPPNKNGYDTCSPECSFALRSQAQRRRFGRAERPARRHAAPAPNGQRPTCDGENRPDVVLVGQRTADVLCLHCGGLHGRWSRHELPPPELCWRCLMRRNAGLDDGMAVSRGV
jgi:hypothetical protein